MENLPKNITAVEEKGTLIINYKPPQVFQLYFCSIIAIIGLVRFYPFLTHEISRIGLSNLIFHFSKDTVSLLFLPAILLLIIYATICFMVNKYIITVNDGYLIVQFIPLPIRIRKTKISSFDIKNIKYLSFPRGRYEAMYPLKAVLKNNKEIELYLSCRTEKEVLAIKTLIEDKLKLKN